MVGLVDRKNCGSSIGLCLGDKCALLLLDRVLRLSDGGLGEDRLRWLDGLGEDRLRLLDGRSSEFTIDGRLGRLDGYLEVTGGMSDRGRLLRWRIRCVHRTYMSLVRGLSPYMAVSGA